MGLRLQIGRRYGRQEELEKGILEEGTERVAASNDLVWDQRLGVGFYDFLLVFHQNFTG